jgi:hypothetical protein
VFVIDDACPLASQFMKPFPGELCKGSPKRILNYRLSRARCIVENAFGILASVFRVFCKPLAVECNIAEVLCWHAYICTISSEEIPCQGTSIHLQAHLM